MTKRKFCLRRIPHVTEEWLGEEHAVRKVRYKLVSVIQVTGPWVSVVATERK